MDYASLVTFTEISSNEMAELMFSTISTEMTIAGLSLVLLLFFGGLAISLLKNI